MDRIIKVADNRVVAETFYYKDDKTEIIVDTKEYGDNELKRLLEEAQTELNIANAIDPVEYKKNKINSAQGKIDKYQALIDVMK